MKDALIAIKLSHLTNCDAFLSFFFAALSGGWSAWTEWSPCGPDCLHLRKRECDNPSPSNGGAECKGRDLSSEGCTGGMCRGKFAATFEYRSLPGFHSFSISGKRQTGSVYDRKEPTGEGK
jgi:hypothetical protein